MSANIIMETKQLCFNYPDGTPALKTYLYKSKKEKQLVSLVEMARVNLLYFLI